MSSSGKGIGGPSRVSSLRSASMTSRRASWISDPYGTRAMAFALRSLRPRNRGTTASGKSATSRNGRRSSSRAFGQSRAAPGHPRQVFSALAPTPPGGSFARTPSGHRPAANARSSRPFCGPARASADLRNGAQTHHRRRPRGLIRAVNEEPVGPEASASKGATGKGKARMRYEDSYIRSSSHSGSSSSPA
jgi:hypothetical protein